jgi:hypothetical protein
LRTKPQTFPFSICLWALAAAISLLPIEGCKQIEIYRSTLIDNAEWKKFALALDKPGVASE